MDSNYLVKNATCKHVYKYGVNQLDGVKFNLFAFYYEIIMVIIVQLT